ncbi:unnamed protein product [Brassica oleracea var. botrytis]
MNMRGPKELSCGGILRSCPYTGAELYSLDGISVVASGVGEPLHTEKSRLDPYHLGDTKVKVEIDLSKTPPAVASCSSWTIISASYVAFFLLNDQAIVCSFGSPYYNPLLFALFLSCCFVSCVVLSFMVCNLMSLINKNELLSQVAWLRSENHQILEKLNQASDSNDLVLQENLSLKEENLELQQVITSMKKLEGGSTSFRGRYCSSSLDHDLDQDFSCIKNDPRTHHPS